jgi:hypothetical protein
VSPKATSGIEPLKQCVRAAETGSTDRILATAIGVACSTCRGRHLMTIWQQYRAGGGNIEWRCSCCSSSEWLDNRQAEG